PETIVPFTQHHDVYPGIDINGALKEGARGKVVLITGSSKGIGAETARKYAQAGAKGLILAARTISNLEALKNEILQNKSRRPSDFHPELQVELCETDVTLVAQVQETVKKGIEAFGRLDVVICNAGYMTSWIPIVEHDPETWWKTWVRGTFNVAHSTLPHLVKSKGHIVVITSVGAQMRIPGGSAYMNGKHALNRFAEFINAEYGEQGVKSFALHPGCMMTELASCSPQFVAMVDAGAIEIDEIALPASVLLRLTSGTEDWLSGRYVSANWDLDDVNKHKDKIIAEELLINKLALSF
ncbi:NAD-P-binding protein, partial [Sistotremastrum niveocremeum HHB9708]